MIYGSGCLGGATDVCATVAEVGLSYTLGVIAGYGFGDSNTCSYVLFSRTIFSCPLGTTSQVKLPITGTILPGPSLVIAWCQETGTNAGTWYYGIPPLSTPVNCTTYFSACNNCPKVYDNTCQGFGIPNLLQWCPTAAEAAIEYTLGLITSIFPFIPSDSCGTIITCPLTTALRIKILGAEIPAPVFYAWCEESGPRVGKWYTGTFLTPIELVSLACKPLI
ncbi:LOW QUALITY PROTEIN: Protein CBG14847, partial [Caenorhabditis briggsae]